LSSTPLPASRSSAIRAAASVAVGRLGGWHLRHASVAPLVQAAWSYRHNLTAADALYVALAEQLGASLLTDDHRLAQAPTFPSHVPVLRLPAGL
jgi:predicted nucleic acid-binding protein